jgi:hypothetical protein
MGLTTRVVPTTPFDMIRCTVYPFSDWQFLIELFIFIPCKQHPNPPVRQQRLRWRLARHPALRRARVPSARLARSAQARKNYHFTSLKKKKTFEINRDILPYVYILVLPV